MKKLISTLLLLVFSMMNAGSFAVAGELKTEHLNNSKSVKKVTPTNVVMTSSKSKTILEYNVIEASFAQNFSTKDAKVGDTIGFLINESLYTTDGTEVLPEGSILQADVVKIIKPKSFNRSGKVEIAFSRIILPDGRNIPFDAKVYSKKPYLSRGKLNAFGKGLGSTLGAGAIATGAGCGIGVAAGAVIIGGFAIGLPVGIAVGALGCLVTPGLHYKAKQGDKILIQLTDNLEIKQNHI